MPVDARISTETEDDQSISKRNSPPVPVASGREISDLTSPPVPSSKPLDQEPPFADFAGRCFLRVCLWGETLATVARGDWSSVAKIESAARQRHEWPRPGWLRSFIGAASCTLAAALTVPIFSTGAYRLLGLLILLAAISYIAVRFGNLAGVAGTICAVLLCAALLFERGRGLAINNPGGRNHLISIVILGVCASDLLGRRKDRKSI